MKYTPRTAAGTAVLALAASALTLPLAAPARASVIAEERTFFMEDSDGDATYELWTDTPSGSPQPLVKSDVVDVRETAVSADASRVAAVTDQLLDNGSTRAQIEVWDVSMQHVRTIGAVTSSGSTGTTLFSPALSPDGTTLVYTAANANGIVLKKTGVGSGTPVSIPVMSFENAFLDDTTLLGNGFSGWFTMPVTGGGTHAVTGIPANAYSVRVSPDGSHLVWILDKSTDYDELADVQVAPISLVNGVATVGTPVTVSSGADDWRPAFSSDGSQVRFIRLDPETYEGDLWTAPADASSPAALVAATPEDEVDVVVAKSDSVNPAGAAVDGPFTLNGTSAVVRWSLPNDADLSGVIVRRDGNWVGYVPAPLTSLNVTGLTLGHTYSFSVEAVDRSGNTAAAASRSLTAIKPIATFADPITKVSNNTHFPVHLAQGAQADTLFTVDYLPYGGAMKPRITGATGVDRTFGGPAATNVLATTPLAGGTYTFRVKVADAYGNTSAWAVSSKAVVPSDQTRATMSGATTLSSGAAYLGTFARLTRTTDYAKITLVGNRLQILGWRGPNTGSFALYDGSTKIATVNTYYSTERMFESVLFWKTYTTNATHTFTIRPLGTAGHPAVVLDGFAMRR